MKQPFFIFLLFINSYAFSQEESFPCKEANPNIKGLFSGKTIDNIYIHDCSGPGLHELCSSFLKPSGEAPEIIEQPGDRPDDSEFVDWTCRYAPGNLMDGDPQTAWVEGKSGYGEGEVVIVPCIDIDKKIQIWAGFGKSEKLFNLNSSPKTLKVAIALATYETASQYGSNYSDLKILASREVELQKLNGYQNLSKPEYNRSDDESLRYLLVLQIVNTYPGSKWDDTCISELRNID